MSRTRETEVPAKFVELLDECSSLISESGTVAFRPVPAGAEPLPSLLEQCRELTDQVGRAVEPIRTIHHFACTGGTLITKCLASLPNTRVLSEVEPHSEIPLRGGQRFFPTDLIQLLRTGTYNSSPELESEVFLRGLDAIYEHSQLHGQRLLLRDHAHSSYCVGPEAKSGQNLREILLGRFTLRSVLTVRHPLDTFLAVSANGWLHFEPATLDELCKRHHRFLDDLHELPITRYEDFVADPRREVERLADQLELPFNPDFLTAFNVHALSGDSGRKGGLIASRPRRPVPEAVMEQAQASEAYHTLCTRLGYDPVIDQSDRQAPTPDAVTTPEGHADEVTEAAQPETEETLRSTLRRLRLPTAFQSLDLFKRLSSDSCGTVLDIGVQKHSTFLMEAFPDSHHHLFEPVSLYHSQILKTYSVANIDHTLHRVALSDEDAQAFLHKLGRDGSGRVTHAQIGDVPDHGMTHLVEIERVAARSLDGMRDRLGLEELTYVVKIDVDGNEERIVAGGKETLRNAALIMIEAVLFENNVLSRARMIEELGFQLWDVCDNAYFFEQLSQVDLVFVNRRLYERDTRFRPWDVSGGLVNWKKWQHGFGELEK